MYSTLITAVALFAPAVAAFAVNSPEFTQCGTSKISWEKTTGPYNVILVDPKDQCGEPLAEIGDFDGSSIQYKVALPAGTLVQISIADANDEEAWSKTITIGESTDSSCLTAANAASDGTTANTDGTTTSTTTDSTTDSTTSSGSDSTTSDSGADSTSGTPGSLAPVGAANAGTNNLFGDKDSAAPSARQLSAPLMGLAAIAAAAALAL